ncbi:MAG: cyclic nucleotide-binding domain-containing protein [Planctomycetota bacterium]|nr:cyclic nucleotide-binding domain-containing protein [Planctomycetota bacterium]
MLKRTVPKINIFQGLTKSQVDELMAWLQRRDYPEQQILFREGQASDGLYMLCRGKVGVIKSSSKGHFRLAELEAPNFFGEMALLTDEPRSSTIRAMAPCICGVLPTEIYRQKMGRQDPIAMQITANLAHLLAERLSEANKEIARLAGRVLRKKSALRGRG